MTLRCIHRTCNTKSYQIKHATEKSFGHEAEGGEACEQGESSRLTERQTGDADKSGRAEHAVNTLVVPGGNSLILFIC